MKMLYIIIFTILLSVIIGGILLFSFSPQLLSTTKQLLPFFNYPQLQQEKKPLTIINETDNLVVNWEHTYSGVNRQEFIVTIMQSAEQVSSSRDVNLNLLNEDLNFNSKDLNIEYFEWQNISHPFEDYYECNHTVTNCTDVNEETLECLKSNNVTVFGKHSDCGSFINLNYYYEFTSINRLSPTLKLPKRTKSLIVEYPLEIKKYKIVIRTPIVKTNGGFGSTGNIYLNVSGNKFYDYREGHSSWWNSSYNYRKNITIQFDNVDSDLTDFPLYINFSDSDIGDVVQANGYDIRFSNTTDDLAYERENYTSGVGHYWVKVPKVNSASNTTIQIYYGNNTADAGLNGERITAVWDANFKAVYHFAGGSLLDSTSNNNDGTISGTVVKSLTCPIGECYDFQGSTDYITIGASSSILSSSPYTMTGWFNTDDTTVNQDIVSMGRESVGDSIRLSASGASTNDVSFLLQDNTVGSEALTSTTFTANAWYYASGVSNSVTSRSVFLNAGGEGTNTDSSSPAPDRSHIGIVRYNGAYYASFNGEIDEVRLSDTNRADAWIKFEYNNIVQDDNELTWGAEETAPVGGDSTPPIVTITTPTNNTNTTNTLLDVNYTATDETALDSCWWTNNSGTNNYSLGTACSNITTETWNEGTHNLIIYANDSTNNVGTATVTFTIDTINPDLNLTFPINSVTYDSLTLDLNYTQYDLHPQSCWYNNGSTTNSTTTTAGTNWTGVTGAEGSNTWIVYCNDSAGNENQSSVTFTIDSIIPNILILTPTNNTNTTNTLLDVNYTASDINLDHCWWTEDSGATNTSLTTNCNNITTETWTEGTHNVIVYVNDTIGNENSSSITFTIDTTAPTLTITSPINNTNHSLAVVDLNYTYIESLSGGNCWYNNNSAANSTSVVMGTNFSGVTGIQGNNIWTLYCNDSLGNEAGLDVSLFIDTIFPQIYFTNPTPADNTVSVIENININISIEETNLAHFIWNWNGTNYTLFDDASVLLLNFNNQSGLGENDTYVVDVSRLNKKGIVVGAALNTSGRFGSAFQFDMDNLDYINLSGKDFNLGSTTGSPITISAWVNVNEGHTLTGKSFPIIDSQWNYDKEGFQFQLSTSSGVILQTGNATKSSKYSFNKSDCYPGVGKWQLVTVVIPAADLDAPRIYIDGIENASDNSCEFGEWQAGLFNYEKTVLPTNPVRDVFVGGSNTLTVDHMFNGTIDEVRIWNRALSSEEIYQLYNSTIYKINNTQLYFFTNITGIGGQNYTYRACANDTVGNLNCTGERHYNVTGVDITPPTFDNPRNFTHTNNTAFSESFTASDDTGIGTYVLNDTSLFNITQAGLITNISAIDTVAIYWLNLSVNDTAGNLNSVVFFINVAAVDISPPVWDLVYGLRNFTQYANLSFSELMTATDDIAIDTYVLNDTSVFNITQAGLITNITKLDTVNTYWLNLSVNDTSGNLLSGVFYIDITNVPVPPVSECNANFTVLQSATSNKRPYGRLCYWLDFR